VLFIDSGNSGLNILATALFTRAAPPGLRAFSAGSHPSEALKTEVADTLRGMNFSIDAFQPKDVASFWSSDSDRIERVVTLSAADEQQAFQFPADVVVDHWKLQGVADGEVAFDGVVEVLEERMAGLIREF
jgi:arsenate reductase